MLGCIAIAIRAEPQTFVLSEAFETSSNSATVQPAECDVRTLVAIRRSSGPPIAGSVRSRVSPSAEPMSSLRENGTVGTSFDIPTRAVRAYDRALYTEAIFLATSTSRSVTLPPRS